MLKLNLVCVGNLKEKYFLLAESEYVKRLSRFCNLKIIELEEFNNTNNIGEIKRVEGINILKNIRGFCILCDVHGKAITSKGFASLIEKQSLQNSEFTFIIGGSYGVSEEVKQASNIIISLSEMTFPHRLFRIMFLEQIYRAFTIINHIPYHK